MEDTIEQIRQSAEKIKGIVRVNEIQTWQTKRINEVEFKGSCRKCAYCGDVKIWDYPNQRKCPSGKNHRWRHIDTDKLSEEEDRSIDEQIKIDKDKIGGNNQSLVYPKRKIDLVEEVLKLEKEHNVPDLLRMSYLSLKKFYSKKDLRERIDWCKNKGWEK